MNSILYTYNEPFILRIPCPHCYVVSRYDTDFVVEAIFENKPIQCVVCEGRFEIVLQKISTPKPHEGI